VFETSSTCMGVDRKGRDKVWGVAGSSWKVQNMKHET